MSLLQKIKNDQVIYRKSKEARDKLKAGALTTLYSEAAMVGKNDGNRESTDVEVVKIIKAFIKHIDETLRVCPKDAEGRHLFEAEKKLLERYLPKQLTEDELKTIISVMVIENGYDMPKDMGKIMKSLAGEYPGKYDGKIASAIARSYK